MNQRLEKKRAVAGGNRVLNSGESPHDLTGRESLSGDVFSSPAQTGPAPKQILYSDDEVSITPSWLNVGSHSYPLGSVRRVRRHYIEPPRRTALAVSGIAVVMMAISGLHLGRGTMPLILGWLMLLASTVLALWALHVVLVQRGVFRLDVRFEDGDSIVVTRKRKRTAEAISQALLDAMDWQRHRTLSLHTLPTSSSTAVIHTDSTADALPDGTSDSLDATRDSRLRSRAQGSTPSWRASRSRVAEKASNDTVDKAGGKADAGARTKSGRLRNLLAIGTARSRSR